MTKKQTELSCKFDGKEYSHGSQLCQEGKIMECADGEWFDTGGDCKDLFDGREEDSEIRQDYFTFSTNTTLNCTSLFSAGKSRHVGIRNNCDECMKAVIYWTGGTNPYQAKYKVEAFGSKIVPYWGNHNHGELIGEEPCDDNYEADQSLLVSIEDELFGEDVPAAPPRVNVEPTELDLERRIGIWTCDPKNISTLKLSGSDIPVDSVVFFKAQKIQWRSGSNDDYTSACPLSSDGGMFRRVKLHGLIFGVGGRYIGCQDHFAIESARAPVWIAINDDASAYGDNQGELQIRVKWR